MVCEPKAYLNVVNVMLIKKKEKKSYLCPFVELLHNFS
jgi:hypothetical protein